MTMPEPTYAPVHPRTHLLLRTTGGWSIAAAILITVTAGVGLLSAWTTWHTYFVVERFLADDFGVTEDDLYAADSLTQGMGFGYLGALLVTAAVFVVWLSRARFNSEVLCEARHRRATGWVIGAWVCPVVNLWFPFQVVTDVWKASRPDTSRRLDFLSQVRGSDTLGWWWGLWLAGFALDRFVAAQFLGDEITPETIRSAAIAETLGALLYVVAAVLIIQVMRQIDGWQAQPR
ncbi:DUF4328 domain-containing protein [Actinokineospora sp.]|uniref:DUF4328 domain-containing protein n=1 Tax=Actinokineospora sp. TaxID=1872133 RepID=UPI004037A1E5